MNFTTGRPPGPKNKKEVMFDEEHKQAPSQPTFQTKVTPSRSHSPPTIGTKQPLTIIAEDGLDVADAMPQMGDDTSASVSPEMFSLEDAMSTFPISPPFTEDSFANIPDISEIETKIQSSESDMPLFSEAELANPTTGIMDFDHSISAPLLTPMNFMDRAFFNEDEEDVEDVMRHDFEVMDQEPWVMTLGP